MHRKIVLYFFKRMKTACFGLFFSLWKIWSCAIYLKMKVGFI